MNTNRYLRNRPFLIINFTSRVAHEVNTRVKGWADEPTNFQHFEHMSIVDRVNKKEMLASIVIDIINGKVIKNSSRYPTETVMSHFVEKYAKKIQNALQVWAQNEIIKNMKDIQKEKVLEEIKQVENEGSE